MADPETPKAPEPPAPAETPATPEPKTETTAERFLRQRDEQLARGGGIFERAAKGFLSGFGGEGGGGPGQVPYGTPSQDVTLKGTGDVTYDITRPQPKEELTRLPRIERVPDLKLSFTEITTGLGGEVDRVLQKSQQEVVSAISQTYNVLKDRVFTIQKSLTILDKNVKIVDVRQRKFQGDTQALLESMKAAIERQKVQQQSIDQKFMKIAMPEKKIGDATRADGGIGDILGSVKEMLKWWVGGKVALAALGGGAVSFAKFLWPALTPLVGGAIAAHLLGAGKYTGMDYKKFHDIIDEQAKGRREGKYVEENEVGAPDPETYRKIREWVQKRNKEGWTPGSKPPPVWKPGAQQPTGFWEDLWGLIGGTAGAAERPAGGQSIMRQTPPTTKTTPDKVSVEKTQVDITAKESVLLKGAREV